MSEPRPIQAEEDAEQERRSEYDVTNSVLVTSAGSVYQALRELFVEDYPQADFDSVWLACHDFERMFSGRDPDYYGIDTPYHDIQHTLDMTLAMGRLMAGYDRSVGPEAKLGAERVKFGLVCALFHDSGYLRHKEADATVVSGAQFTRTHVGRSAKILQTYLPRIGLNEFAGIAAGVVHFTGYEMPLKRIRLPNEKDYLLGRLLGTADLIAQMADRCYLEKCRDRLYPEFVIGDVAFQAAEDGRAATYYSGLDLLQKTLVFYRNAASRRLTNVFGHVYRYAEGAFDDKENHYVAFIRKNLEFLSAILRDEEWERLRRRAPCVIPDQEGEARMMTLALQRLRERSEDERRAKSAR